MLCWYSKIKSKDWLTDIGCDCSTCSICTFCKVSPVRIARCRSHQNDSERKKIHPCYVKTGLLTHRFGPNTDQRHICEGACISWLILQACISSRTTLNFIRISTIWASALKCFHKSKHSLFISPRGQSRCNSFDMSCIYPETENWRGTMCMFLLGVKKKYSMYIPTV